MRDVIQQGVQTLASQNALTRDVAIACATAVLYLLGAAWLVAVVWQRARLTVAVVARVALLAVLAYGASLVLTGIVSDPRPYIVARTRALTPVGHDNGFPSDHTLLAAALTASLWWIDRRLLAAFAVGTLLIALGRLGIGAHHTLDVLGSLAIAAVAARIVGALPLPAAWRRPLPLPPSPPFAARRP